ncbi:hypothetical protein JB92DRAFT_2981994 [Gautieria morchelliformis]|nr:hypothetical protein JB92DRAFT_2981994 [Gautieria morchelliformis]
MTTLEMLYEELANLETTRERLISQRKGVDKALAAIHVRISETENINWNARTSNLPSEILSIIFEAGLHAQLTLLKKQWPQQCDQWPFEIVVSHVSRRWRNVALKTPRLWSYIFLDPCTSRMELLDICLEISSEQLLDIRVRIPVYPKGNPQRQEFFRAQFRRQLTTLIPHAARWRHLSITPQNHFIEDLSLLTDVCAPALESLSVGIKDAFDIMNVTHSVPFFTGGAPVLSSVELYGYCIKLFRLPLASVTSLTLHGCTLSQEEAHVLFSPLHCLTHLYLQADQIHYTNLPPIKLPSVISLYVFLTYRDAIGVLNSLDIPAVKTFTVFQNSNADIFAFVASLHQTYPSLRALQLLGTSCGVSPVTPMLDFIAPFPNIEEVSFDYEFPLVHALNAEFTEGPPWPHLHTMAVTAPKPRWTRWPVTVPKPGLMLSIIELIDRRIASGYAISHLIISDNVTRQIGMKELQQLRGRVVLEECAAATVDVWGL